MSTRSANGGQRAGFTLGEIMIVVVLIGLLAALAVPSYMRARVNSQDSAFLNDVRVFTGSFNQYVMETGSFPPDEVPGVIPADVVSYMPRAANWSEPTTIGGRWDWDYGLFGVTAGLSVHLPSRTTADMEKIDGKLDDGELSTGTFRERSQGYIYILQP